MKSFEDDAREQTLQAVREAKKTNEKRLMDIPNVVSVGVGFKEIGGLVTDEMAVIVTVTEKRPHALIRSEEVIPLGLRSNESVYVRTDVQEGSMPSALRTPYPLAPDVGPYVPVSDKDVRIFDPKQRIRPLIGGISIGHVDITAGTLGCFVMRDGKICMLSNNHVLANSNAGKKGDAIIQPGKADGGSSWDDVVGHLVDYVPIAFSSQSGCPILGSVAKTLNVAARILGRKSRLVVVTTEVNLVDAAIASVEVDAFLKVYQIGVPSYLVEGTLGTKIRKYGRTTEYKEDVIKQIDVTSNVSYGSAGIAMYEDQLLAGAMSAGGDSGSAIFDQGQGLVGLLFAGSETTTVINRIQNVFEVLDLSLLHRV